MAITAPVTTRAKGGFRTATYRDAQGRTWGSLIIGPGSTSGYKVRITSRRGIGGGATGCFVDNVPLATAMKGATNGLHSRIS